MDVDVVLDMMIHDIDLVLTLARAPPVSVAASGVEVMSGMTDEAEAWLTFADGLIATISVSRVADGIEREKRVVEFPLLMVSLLRRMRLAPDALYDRMPAPYGRRKLDPAKVKQ